jgi:hypothetical protein
MAVNPSSSPIPQLFGPVRDAIRPRGSQTKYNPGRIEGELLMEEGLKENYLWMKDRRRITYGGRIEGELLMVEG